MILSDLSNKLFLFLTHISKFFLNSLIFLPEIVHLVILIRISFVLGLMNNLSRFLKINRFFHFYYLSDWYLLDYINILYFRNFYILNFRHFYNSLIRYLSIYILYCRDLNYTIIRNLFYDFYILYYRDFYHSIKRDFFVDIPILNSWNLYYSFYWNISKYFNYFWNLYNFFNNLF
jgi:hypothetical protein